VYIPCDPLRSREGSRDRLGGGANSIVSALLPHAADQSIDQLQSVSVRHPEQ
jgi:hypothetical protein